MKKAVQAVRGMNDVLPEKTIYWRKIESVCQKIANSYGYGEIRFPLLEQTALFSRTIGEATDIVEKEMYTFADRNGDSLTLRPEGTAGCVRAAIQAGLLYHQIQRLWYIGPMFRHERPQKGRYRQFHQLGIEAYGMNGPDIDAEVILLSARLFKEFKIFNGLELQINTLATPASRALYREKLVAFYQKHYDLLDEDSQRRLVTNPLRILDSKNPIIQELNQAAPLLVEHLDPDSRHHFEGLKELLGAADLPFQVNPRLVRGIDYYGLTVFEWVTESLGAQGTVCAGGRYNDLVEQLGGQPTPAVGFAIGLERLALLIEAQQTLVNAPDIYIILLGEEANRKGFTLAEELRQQFPQLQIVTHLTSGNLKNQLKAADKSQARWAIILGDQEIQNNTVLVKDLHPGGEQKLIPRSTLIDFVNQQTLAVTA